MTRTHGLSHKHPLYERWSGMLARCTNPRHAAYRRYGGRGIAISPSWRDFTLFLADVEPTWPGPGYDLHRIDNDGDYGPHNCAWLPKSDHMSLPKSEQHRAAIGAAHKGRRHSAEHAQRNGLAHRAKLDPEWLREMYVERGLSIYAIAAEAGCGKSSVGRALKRHGITR